MTFLIGILLLVCSWTPSGDAKAGLLEQIKAANLPEKSFMATWHRVQHSSMLVNELESEGKVYLLAPDKIRWETTEPVKSVSILSPDAGNRGRFRLPTEKDFNITVLEGDNYTVRLDPVRRDLKQMLGQIALTVDRKSLKILYVMIVTPEGDWQRIEFSKVEKDIPIAAELFEGQ